MKKIAILQSNYIPWKGYFDLINSVDEFIILDEMQYTKNDWRNRNRIKTIQGILWLTIPVRSECLSQKINETQIAKPWGFKHWKTLTMAYAKAPCFSMYKDVFEEFYTEKGVQLKNLSQINVELILMISKILGIKTKISLDTDYGVIKGKNERLIDLCRKTSATTYLSGPAAKDYISYEMFKEAGINLEWIDYSDYPEYPQLYPPFEHGVSILDLLFSVGSDAYKYMKSFK